jgi:hypothetical protein
MLENIPPATVTTKITAATPVGRLCHPKTSPVPRNGRLVAEPRWSHDAWVYRDLDDNVFGVVAVAPDAAKPRRHQQPASSYRGPGVTDRHRTGSPDHG